MKVKSLQTDFTVTTTATFERILKLDKPSDPIALYSFYLYTANRQETKSVRATTSFVAKALNWGIPRVTRTKKQLEDLGLIENIKRRDENNQIIGHYVLVKYSPILQKNHTVEIPQGRKTTAWKNDRQILYTSNRNTNVTKVTNTKKRNTTNKRKDKRNELISIASDLVVYFNKAWGKNYRSVTPLLNNLEYWLDIYTPEEIKKAIDNAKTDTWWRDKLTPTILIRRRNPQGEEVDYIGKFLNMVTDTDYTIDKTGFSELAMWRVGRELKVPTSHWRKRRRQFLEMLEDGSLAKKHNGTKTAIQVFREGLQNEMKRGIIEPANEVDQGIFFLEHPERKELDHHLREINKMLEEGKKDAIAKYVDKHSVKELRKRCTIRETRLGDEGDEFDPLELSAET